jgi:hypothetical protein
MRNLTFYGYANFGPGNSVDMEIDVDLTDEEYARLLAAVDADEWTDSLSDIHEKVLDLLDDQVRADMIAQFEENGEEFDEDYLPQIGVNFPEHIAE